MSSIKQNVLKQRRVEQQQQQQQKKVQGGVKNILKELIEGYDKSTNQLVKKFDQFVLLPSVILTFTLLTLTFVTNTRSTTFNKLLASFGFFLGNFVFNFIFRDKINVEKDIADKKKLLGGYLFYHAVLFFICIKLFTTAPPK